MPWRRIAGSGNQHRRDATAALSAEADHLAAQEAELDAQNRALQEEHAALEGQKSEVGRQMEAWELQLQDLQAELRRRVNGSARSSGNMKLGWKNSSRARTNWQSEVANWRRKSPRRRHRRSCPLHCIPNGWLRCRNQSAPESKAAATPVTPPNMVPVDQATMLPQTSPEIDRANEEEQSEENANFKDEPDCDRLFEKPPIDISAPVSNSRQSAESNAGEDVSIDEYMSRLLARSRGDSVPLSGPTTPMFRSPAAAATGIPSAVPKSSPPPVASRPKGEQPRPGEPMELWPHAVAPERQIDLQAMRQLANLSAKNALHKHESKQLSGTTRTKLLVTSVAAIVGVSLLVIHHLPGAPPVTIYGALASFAVVALWGMNYVSLLSRMAGADGLFGPPSQGGQRSGGGQRKESIIPTSWGLGKEPRDCAAGGAQHGTPLDFPQRRNRGALASEEANPATKSALCKGHDIRGNTRSP